jgi:hypothetical protein
VLFNLILFLDFETFCEDVSCNKLCISTNFIFLGLMNQKLWMFENLRRSMGRAGMCWSQLCLWCFNDKL